MLSIEFRNVSKTFGRTIALSNLSFKIEEGRLVSILGPSGCGKTTLLRLIAGLESPDEGQILIGERIVSSRKEVIPPHLRGIGMIFQDLGLWPHMSVRENVEFGLKSKGLSKRERLAKLENISGLVRLNGHLNSFPHQLSGGEQQRVALARAMVVEPKILLMDEPLSMLDIQLKRDLRSEVVALHKRLKITMIYVTHDQEDAVSISDSVMVMNQGQIEQIGTFEELYQRPASQVVSDFMKGCQGCGLRTIGASR